jgi:hypothetical protein
LRRLDRVRSWKMHGTRRRACFSAWTDSGRRIARVLVRRRQGESTIAMVNRGLDELTRRLWHGMPPPKPEMIARRKLREAPSASRHVN